MFVRKQRCSRERYRLGHPHVQRPGDDQNDLLPVPEHFEHDRHIKVTNSPFPAASPPPSPDSSSGPSYLRCPRLRQICIPRAERQPSWQTKSQSGRALNCTCSKKSSVFILKDTELWHENHILPAVGCRGGVGRGC